MKQDNMNQNGITQEYMNTQIIDFYNTYTNFELTEQYTEYMRDGLTPDGMQENPVNNHI